MVLLAASGLLLRSFEKMRQVDLGYRVDHTLVASYSLPRHKYGTQSAVNAFNQELERRLQRLPGVKSTGITSSIPAAGEQQQQWVCGGGPCVAEGQRSSNSRRSFRLRAIICSRWDASGCAGVTECGR